MKDICIHDIGDGLAAKIITIDNNVIQLDCGSQQYPQKASDSLFSPPPNFFIISHYHKDHYNGLLMNSTRSLSLKEVFLPRLPEFPDKAHFLKCLLAINWLVGDASGVMEADFLNILSKINTCPFSYKMVSQGEQINIGSSKFDVLWPPMKIDDQNTLKCISSAIQDFNIAKEENGSLREVFDKIQNLNSISITKKLQGNCQEDMEKS